MRIFIVVLICILAGVSCQNKPHYTISGKISGDAEGMRVFLSKDAYPVPVLIDSTVIKGGKFVFEGVVEEPDRYLIGIDKTKKENLFRNGI